jgi:hypothetical protein
VRRVIKKDPSSLPVHSALRSQNKAAAQTTAKRFENLPPLAAFPSGSDGPGKSPLVFPSADPSSPKLSSSVIQKKSVNLK